MGCLPSTKNFETHLLIYGMRPINIIRRLLRTVYEIRVSLDSLILFIFIKNILRGYVRREIWYKVKNFLRV